MIGRVVSTKLKNTATVLVERVAKHPLYKKTYVQSKKYLVDDPIRVKEGDLVEIINCKPVSKNKNWRVLRVVGKDLAEIAEAKLKKAAAEVIAEVMPEEKAEEPKESNESGEPKEIKAEKLKKKKGTIP